MRGEQLVQQAISKGVLFGKRHGSTVLTCIGTVGVVATAVTAAKATPKALMLLEEAEETKGKELSTMEKLMVAAPAYIPATLIGASTIACIFGAHVLDKRQQAALTSAYALLNSSYKEYRNKVKDILGEQADSNILNEIAKDKYDETKVVKAEEKKEETCLFFEEFRGQYFESTLEEVKNAEYHLNRKLALQDYVELNDFYILMNLPPTEFGATTGWSTWHSFEMYGYDWIDIRCVEDEINGNKFYRIEWVIAPELDFLDY